MVGMRMVMISFFRRTRMRPNGTSSEIDSFGSSPAKRASLRSQSMNASMGPRGPARNRLMPSGASRMVPLSSSASQRSRMRSRSSGRSCRLTKR